jgi:hypothetical protein
MKFKSIILYSILFFLVAGTGGCSCFKKNKDTQKFIKSPKKEEAGRRVNGQGRHSADESDNKFLPLELKFAKNQVNLYKKQIFPNLTNPKLDEAYNNLSYNVNGNVFSKFCKDFLSKNDFLGILIKYAQVDKSVTSKSYYLKNDAKPHLLFYLVKTDSTCYHLGKAYDLNTDVCGIINAFELDSATANKFVRKYYNGMLNGIYKEIKPTITESTGSTISMNVKQVFLTKADLNTFFATNPSHPNLVFNYSLIDISDTEASAKHPTFKKLDKFVNLLAYPADADYKVSSTTLPYDINTYCPPPNGACFGDNF